MFKKDGKQILIVDYIDYIFKRTYVLIKLDTLINVEKFQFNKMCGLISEIHSICCVVDIFVVNCTSSLSEACLYHVHN